jgi:colanic acid/amylovoran biosynthesis protein
MVSPGGFLADVRKLDVMLDIGAGDSFADIYADKRFAYLVATKLIPLWNGVPLLLSPQTIGPFSRQPHSAIAGFICTRATHVFTRDPISLEVTRRLAPAARATQVIDVAFALPYQAPVRSPGAPLRVGINVSGLLMSADKAGGRGFGLGYDHAALVRRLIARFGAMPGVEVHLVPHVFAPHLPLDDDARACDRLAAEFPFCRRAPDFASPSDAKSYIAGLDFLVGGRMHATIAAFSAGVPVVPLSYSNKFEGLYAGLDYPWLVKARGMDTEAAEAMVMRAFEDREVLAARIAAAMPGVEARMESYVATLAALFSGMALPRPGSAA